MSKMRSLPPGPRQSSVRQLMRFARDPILFVEDCHARYGDVYTTHLTGLPPIVNFARSDAAREIFANSEDTMWAGEAALPIEFLVGRFSLTRLDGSRHKRERKLMLPALHGERIVAYGVEMSRITDEVVSTWRSGQSFSLQDAMQEITIRVILQTVFGVDGEHAVKRLVTDFLRLAMKPDVTVLSMLMTGERLRRWLGQHYAPIVGKTARFGGPFAHLPFGELARCAQELDAVLLDEIVRRRKATEGRNDVTVREWTSVEAGVSRAISRRGFEAPYPHVLEAVVG